MIKWLQDFNMTGRRITNLGAPTQPDDGASKSFVETAVAAVGGGKSVTDRVFTRQNYR